MAQILKLTLTIEVPAPAGDPLTAIAGAGLQVIDSTGRVVVSAAPGEVATASLDPA